MTTPRVAQKGIYLLVFCKRTRAFYSDLLHPVNAFPWSLDLVKLEAMIARESLQP